MRAKRRSKSKPDKDRPKLEKELLQDLTVGREGEAIKGGQRVIRTGINCQQAGNATQGCNS